MVTNVTVAVFFTIAGVTKSGPFASDFLLQMARQRIFVPPTVTSVFSSWLTELQLHPAKLYPPRENPPEVAVVNVSPVALGLSVGVVPSPRLRS